MIDFSQFVFGMTQRLSDLFQLVLTQQLFHLLSEELVKLQTGFPTCHSRKLSCKIQKCGYSGLLLQQIFAFKMILSPLEIFIHFLSSGFNCECIHIVHFHKVPRQKNYTQSDFRVELGKQLIGSFSVRKYEPKVQPLFISPDASNDQFVNHENTRMPCSRGKVCKTHLTNLGKTQHTVYGCLACNVHLCKRCHVKWHT